ncbi:hypothetical protein ACFQ08_26155 [Streptosporangium algeriense]|uniref:WXG100 family type VII secretion target n=1 Tax=Streptosporangium algeriense TaxID=1682748 RepID=A0ABW3DYL4_9ACTN
MTLDIHVTSDAIRALYTEVTDVTIPKVRELGGLIGETGVPFPGWGAAGELAIGIKYREIQQQVEGKFTQALEVLASWQEGLLTAQANWRTAESASGVVVRR